MARRKMHDELERFGAIAPLDSIEVANLATGSHAALGAAFHLGYAGSAQPGRRSSAAQDKGARTKRAG